MKEPHCIGRCQFGKYECDVLLGCYHKPPHPNALILMGRNTDARIPIAVASVFLDYFAEEQLPDEVVIKNWSENRGMHETLQQAGIIGPVLRRLAPTFEPREFIPATVHKLLVR